MKKFTTLLLCLALTSALFTSCGKSADTPEVPANSEDAIVTEVPEEEKIEDEKIEEVPEAPLEETEAAPAEVTNTASVALSDDIYSFQLAVNDDVYTFPMTYEEFTAKGWAMSKESDLKLDPYQYDLQLFKKDDASLTIYIINLGEDTLPFQNCLVGGINFSSYDVQKSQMTFTLPGGIQFGVSSKEDAAAKYGTPTDTYEGSLSTKYTYSYDSHSKVDLSFDLETGVLSDIKLQNFVMPEGFVSESSASADSSAVPKAVTDYKAPTELGEDFSQFIIDFDGDLYRVPAPVSEFIANGWKIKPEDSDSVVSAKKAGWVSLMRNNQTMRVMARNYSESKTVIENCFVLTIESYEHKANVPATIQKGITMGMSKKDLEAKLKGTSYESEEGGSYYYYRILCTDSKLDNIEISVNKDSDKVYKITMNNDPKYADFVK